MAKDNCLSSPYLGKKFVYFEIEWTIDDFCFRMHENEAEIQSPEFTGWDGTKFVLGIESFVPKENDEGPSLVLRMKRSNSDTGPREVSVNWRLNLYGENYAQKAAVDDKWDKFEKGFEKKTRITSKTGLINTILKDIQDVNGPDSVIVECKMLSYSEDVKTEFECSDKGLALLSETLFDVYKSGVGSDIELELKSGSSAISCHKGILCARNKVFRDLIMKPKVKEPVESKKAVESNKSEELVESNNINIGDNYEMMNRIIAYIYTGNLKHILDKPSLAIFDCAALCDISEICDYYGADSLVFHSSSDVQQQSFRWRVKDYKTLFRNRESTFSPLIEDGSNRSWQLSLSASSDEEQTFTFTFYLKSVKKLTALRVYLELRVECESTCYWCKNQIFSDLDCSEQFGFKDVFSTDDLPSGDTFSLVVKLKLYTGADYPIPDVGRHTFRSATCSQDQSYRTLSDDLGKMLEEGVFHDFCCEDYNIKAHKYLIDARCSVFCDVVRKHEKTIEPRIIHCILTYIYNGILPSGVSDLDLVKVYKAAGTFELPVLQKTCSELLKDRVKEVKLRLMYKILDTAMEVRDKALYVLARKAIRKELRIRALSLEKGYSTGDETIKSGVRESSLAS